MCEEELQSVKYFRNSYGMCLLIYGCVELHSWRGKKCLAMISILYRMTAAILISTHFINKIYDC
jgi:hypothetical protein